MHLDDFIPFVVPVVMYLFGGDHTLLQAMKMYLTITLFGGFYFGIIGLKHHHPEVLHDGDPIRLVVNFGTTL